MSEQGDRRLAGISRGALVARMAGSISLAIGLASGAVGFMADVGPRWSIAIRAAAGVAIAAAVILSIVRWINRRSH
jgi:hypothetical protein